MNRLILSLIIYIFFILQWVEALFAVENFILIDGITNEIVIQLGPHINQQISPCSTFKIPLSLMGYDRGILKDEQTPRWPFQQGYDDYLQAWKSPQTPQTWMQYSCVWYSKLLVLQLELETIQRYLALLEYGNQDMSTGLAKLGSQNPPWIHSSLKISPREQVDFIQKMVKGSLLITPHAIQMTRSLLFKERLPKCWKLFGKTGWSGSIADGQTLEYGWFVGWIEKDNSFFPFAYLICEEKIDLDQRIPRVKQLLYESAIMERE